MTRATLSTVDPEVAPTATRAPTSPLAAFVVGGTGAALPDRVVDNHEISEHLETNHDWIVTRTGIEERRWASSETTTSMAVAAAEVALSAASTSATDLDLLVVATATPDNPCPSTAARVAAALGARCGSFDINGACTGFVHALWTAAAHLHATRRRGTKALVIGADRFSTLVDHGDRSTAVLFGDGAGAMVIAAEDPIPGGPGIHGVDLAGDPDALETVGIPVGATHIHMDGPALFRKAVGALVSSGRRALAKAGIEATDVDLWVPHQANIRIIDAAAQRLGIPGDRIVHDVATRANTSAASIPLALHTATTTGRPAPGDDVLLSGIGAGLGWGSLHIRWGEP